jgi:type IV secretion system protein VirB1
MMLSLALFTQLAASCAPSVHVDTLAAIARTESGFHVHAIHDNADGRSYLPARLEEAIAIATDLVSAKRHSVDVGLMQVNSANLSSLGLSLAQAFDPCLSLKAGARVLAASYQPPPAGQDPQPALLQALSRYNTGHPARGFANGYVARVVASAEQVVPAIRLGASPVSGPAESTTLAPTFMASPPPAWEVFGRARYARFMQDQAGSRQLLQAPLPMPMPMPALQSSGQPVQLQPAVLRETRREASDVR